MYLGLDWGQSTLNVLVTSTGRNFYTENKLAAANILEKKLWAKQWVPKPEISIIMITWAFEKELFWFLLRTYWIRLS